MLRNRCLRGVTICGISLLCFKESKAQLKAYGGRKTDNNCKTVYLVNPSADSIFYIQGLAKQNLNDCHTYYSERIVPAGKYKINMSQQDGEYFLLLPKDTLVYNIIIPADRDRHKKELLLSASYSPGVIKTNEDKKRNRQIKRLKKQTVAVPVKE